MLASLGLIAALASAPDDVSSIQKLVDSALLYAEQNPKAKKMVMLQDGQWVKMETDGDHLGADDMAKEDVEAVAFAWSRNGRTEVISHTLVSHSGDSFVYSTSVFRADRSLAFVEFNYNGFSPFEGRVSRKNFYGRDGEVLKSSTEWVDFDGKKFSDQAKSENALIIGQVFYWLPVYPNVRLAPYVDLIAK